MRTFWTDFEQIIKNQTLVKYAQDAMMSVVKYFQDTIRLKGLK